MYVRNDLAYDAGEQSLIDRAKAIEADISFKRREAAALRAEAEKARQTRVAAELKLKQEQDAKKLRQDREDRLRTSAAMIVQHVKGAASNFHLENKAWGEEPRIQYNFDAPFVEITFRFRPKV